MGRDWIVRPKGERDVEGVVALLAAMAQGEDGRWFATRWPFDFAERTRAEREALRERRSVGWVAADERAILADLTVFAIADDEPEFGMMVAPTHRRVGIGRALLESAIAWARANAKPALTLRVYGDNDVALALYRATGFVQTDIEPTAQRLGDKQRDVCLMRRAIS